MSAVAGSSMLTEAALLAAWEDGIRRGPVDRALALVGRAVSGQDAAALERWPIGRRDAALLDVHEATFGERLDGVTECANCGEPLELGFAVRELRARHAAGDGERVDAGGCAISLRPPTTADLRAAAAAADAAAGERALLERCVVSAEYDGRPVAPTDLPAESIEALDRRLAELDPQSDLRIALTCPECAHRWSVGLDPADFVWREVEARAHELLADVAALAALYGWSESDVLALSPARRAAYLELAA